MKTPLAPGLTIRSLPACLLGLMLMGLMIQIATMVMNATKSFAESALPAPAIIVFVAFSLASAGLYAITRFRLLTREESLCVLFALLIGAPIMGQGFWQSAVGVLTTLPRSADFERLEAMSGRLWPHGPNLLAGTFGEDNRSNLVIQGGARWTRESLHNQDKANILTLENRPGEAHSSVRIGLSLYREGKPYLLQNEPYLLSVLARATDLSGDASYFCRIYYDESEDFDSEAFFSRQEKKLTYLQRDGFVPVGKYGIEFDAHVREKVWIEFGLAGQGHVQFFSPRLVSVGALERTFTGVRVVSESEYAALPPTQRAGLVAKPDQLISWRGLKYGLKAYVPVQEWLEPAWAWLSFLLLLIGGMLAINCIMRKQWMDNERYPLPMTRIPMALIGEGDSANSALPPIWKNRVMWLGFGLSLFWCLMRIWRLYNPNAPNMEVRVPLAPYFSSPDWGATWNGVEFTVSATFLSLAIFLELNVLLSIVIGFLLFRMQLWVGEAMGWTTHPNYPFPKEQGAAAYVAYAAILILFTRKYLWRTIREAIAGGWKTPPTEVMSYRTSYLLLLASIAGVALWARWLGTASTGLVLFFLLLLTFGFVAAKFRCECGTPDAQIIPYEGIRMLPLLGGILVFQPGGIVTAIMLSLILCRFSFFLIPGLQLELIELGKRLRVRPRHLIGTCLIGLVGGFVIGGWVFLSNSYALGGDYIRNQGPYRDVRWYFIMYNTELNKATNQMLDIVAFDDDRGPAVDPGVWAMAYAGVGTALTAFLRQMFAGFWFHPMGFILGASWMSAAVWGSALTAWAIRLVALRLGGAATVRNKLLPFFTGVFIAAMAAHVIHFLINSLLLAFYPSLPLEGTLF